jgi:hypothetical protein
MASALLKSDRPDRYSASRRSSLSGPHAKITPISPRSLDREPLPLTPPTPNSEQPGNRVVPMRSPARQTPGWLKALMLLQHGSSAIGLGLVSVILVVYGQTVYLQQRWDKATSRLDALRQDERQMAMMKEAVEYDIAAQTEKPHTGLVPVQPGNFLVLPAAAVRPTPAASSPSPKPATSFPPPMGY